MSSNLIFRGLTAIGAGLAWPARALAQAADGLDCPEGTVPLIETLGPEKCIPIEAGARTFILYFNNSVTFIFQVAVGACVVWVLIAGFGIMLTGGDAGKRGEWIERLQWAIGGLLILMFSGFLLRTLNSLFFK